jgi:hypothetical protein
MSGIPPSDLSTEAQRAKGDKPREPPCSFRDTATALREDEGLGRVLEGLGAPQGAFRPSAAFYFSKSIS